MTLASGGSMTLNELCLPVDLAPQLLVDMPSKRFLRLAAAPLSSPRMHVVLCALLQPSPVALMQNMHSGQLAAH